MSVYRCPGPRLLVQTCGRSSYPQYLTLPWSAHSDAPSFENRHRPGKGASANKLPAMSEARKEFSLSSTPVNRKPAKWNFLIGGNNAGALLSTELYDPTTATWEFSSATINSRQLSTATQPPTVSCSVSQTLLWPPNH